MISAGELAGLRATVQSAFPHTCTLTPRVSGTEDAWGDQTTSPGTPQPLVPCSYREQSTSLIGPNGLEVVTIPILKVAATQPINPGDKVSDIVDSKGETMLEGPVEVDDVSRVGLAAGGALHLQVRLRRTQTV